MRLNDPNNFTLECDFNKILIFANSNAEKNRAISQNKNVRSAPYPLTREFLINYYNSTNFYLKQFYKNSNCASDVYSYFVATYGATSQYSGGTGSQASGAQTGGGSSLGLNPFFGLKLQEFPLFLIVLALAGAYLVLKD